MKNMINNFKKGLSLMLTAIMVFGTFAVGIDGVIAFAADATTSQTADLSATSTELAGKETDVYLIVPEAIYLTPSTANGTTNFQYYLNNKWKNPVYDSDNETIKEAGTIIPGDDNGYDTKGYIYWYCKNQVIKTDSASNVTNPATLTYTVCDTSLKAKSGVNPSITYNDGKTSAFSSNKESRIFTGSLSTNETCVLRWCMEYEDGTTGNDGKNIKKRIYAYTYVYKPYQGYSAAIGRSVAYHRGLLWSHTTMTVTGAVWLQGTQKIDGGSCAYKFAPITGNGLEKATADDTYVEGSGSNYNYGWEYGNEGPTKVSVTGGTSSLYIDSSRITTYSQIPNFRIGLDICNVDSNDGARDQYVKIADNTIYTVNKEISGTERLYDSNTKDSNGNSTIAKSVPSSSCLINIEGHLETHKAGTECIINAILPVDVYVTNKSSLRAAVTKAEQYMNKFGVCGIDDDGKLLSRYFQGKQTDDKEDYYKWDEFVTAYNNAVIGLITLDASCDAGALESTLEGAMNALNTKVTYSTDDSQTFYNWNLANGISVTATKITNGSDETVAENGIVITKDNIKNLLKSDTSSVTKLGSSDFENKAYVNIGINSSVEVEPKTKNNYSPIAFRTGYDFAGFTTDKNGTVSTENISTDGLTALVVNGVNVYSTNGQQLYTGFNVNVVYNETVYTKWKPHEWKVTLDANGGVDGTTTSVIGTYGSPLPDISSGSLPTRDGYTFAGFNSKQDGTGTTYYSGYYKKESGEWVKDTVNNNGTYETNAGKSAKDINYTIDSQTTLYAIWIPNIITVTLNNGNTGTGHPEKGETQITATYGENMPTISQIPTKTGHEFLGYYDAEEDGNQIYDENLNPVGGENVTEETEEEDIIVQKWQVAAENGNAFFYGKEGDTDRTTRQRTTTLYAHWRKNIYDLKISAGIVDTQNDTEKAIVNKNLIFFADNSLRLETNVNNTGTNSDIDKFCTMSTETNADGSYKNDKIFTEYKTKDDNGVTENAINISVEPASKYTGSDVYTAAISEHNDFDKMLKVYLYGGKKYTFKFQGQNNIKYTATFTPVDTSLGLKSFTFNSVEDKDEGGNTIAQKANYSVDFEYSQNDKDKFGNVSSGNYYYISFDYDKSESCVINKIQLYEQEATNQPDKIIQQVFQSGVYIPDPVCNGYDFTGWTATVGTISGKIFTFGADDRGTGYVDGGLQPNSTDDEIEKDFIDPKDIKVFNSITATWHPHAYKITFNAVIDGATINWGEPNTDNVAYALYNRSLNNLYFDKTKADASTADENGNNSDSSVTTMPVAEIEGYIFDGWYTMDETDPASEAEETGTDSETTENSFNAKEPNLNGNNPAYATSLKTQYELIEKTEGTKTTQEYKAVSKESAYAITDDTKYDFFDTTNENYNESGITLYAHWHTKKVNLNVNAQDSLHNSFYINLNRDGKNDSFVEIPYNSENGGYSSKTLEFGEGVFEKNEKYTGTIEGDESSTYYLAPVITTPGYTFKGWATTASGEDGEGNSTIITINVGTDESPIYVSEYADNGADDVNLYAIWEAKKYEITLTYKDNSGKGELVKELSKIVDEKEEKYTEITVGEVKNLSDDYYDSKTEETYGKVTTIATVTFGQVPDNINMPFTGDNYDCVGYWATRVNSSGENDSITARYFNADGSAFTCEAVPEGEDSGSYEKNISTGIFTKIWDIAVDWSIPGSSDKLNENCKLTGKWDAATYTITLDWNGGSSNPDAKKTIEIRYNEPLPSIVFPSKDNAGEEFDGYYTTSDCTYDRVTGEKTYIFNSDDPYYTPIGPATETIIKKVDGEIVKTEEVRRYKLRKDLTLVAKWSSGSSHLQIYLDGSRCNIETAPDETYEYTDKFPGKTVEFDGTKGDVLKIPVPKKAGYTFISWNREGTNGQLKRAYDSKTGENYYIYTFGTRIDEYEKDSEGKRIKEIKETLIGEYENDWYEVWDGPDNALEKIGEAKVTSLDTEKKIITYVFYDDKATEGDGEEIEEEYSVLKDGVTIQTDDKLYTLIPLHTKGEKIYETIEGGYKLAKKAVEYLSPVFIEGVLEETELSWNDTIAGGYALYEEVSGTKEEMLEALSDISVTNEKDYVNKSYLKDTQIKLSNGYAAIGPYNDSFLQTLTFAVDLDSVSKIQLDMAGVKIDSSSGNSVYAVVTCERKNLVTKYTDGANYYTEDDLDGLTSEQKKELIAVQQEEEVTNGTNTSTYAVTTLQTLNENQAGKTPTVVRADLTDQFKELFGSTEQLSGVGYIQVRVSGYSSEDKASGQEMKATTGVLLLNKIELEYTPTELELNTGDDTGSTEGGEEGTGGDESADSEENLSGSNVLLSADNMDIAAIENMTIYSLGGGSGELPVIPIIDKEDEEDEGGETGGTEGNETGGTEGSETGGNEGNETGGTEGNETGGNEGNETGGNEGSETGGNEGELPVVPVVDDDPSKDEPENDPEEEKVATGISIINRKLYNDTVVGYKQNITFHCTVENPVPGSTVVWYVNGEKYATGSYCKVTEPKKTYEIYCVTTDSDGKEVKSLKETVKVKSSFFAKLSYFFKKLFGKLEDLEQI